METKAQRGYLVLADISGFTAYMAATELEHSQDIMADLLETIIGTLAPPLTLSKLEGDAVFVYAPHSKLTRGETLVELIEKTYLAFRDRITSIKHRTTCSCDACRALPTLDLKFFVHFGDYINQRVAQSQEIVGSAVNLVHRLMKNGVSDATGWRAYVLYSAAALEQIGLSPEGMATLTESYEHLGEVQTYSMDMSARYQELVEARRVVVEAEQAHKIVRYDLQAPPIVVWEWLNDPERRNELGDGKFTWTSIERLGGRTKVGARNHCAHGKGANIETILDWRPFEYVSASSCSSSGKGMQLQTTLLLTPIEGGTRVENRIVITGLPRLLVKLIVGPIVAMMYRKIYESLEVKLREEPVVESVAVGEETTLIPSS